MNKSSGYNPLYTRVKRPPYYVIASALITTAVLIWALNGSHHRPPHVYHHGFNGQPGFVGPVRNKVPVPCLGARGVFLSRSQDDSLGQVTFDDPPQPYAGSYQDLGLNQTWLTASQRYGPYGMGEDLPDYNRSRVNWEEVDWAELQNECMARNHERFDGHSHFHDRYHAHGPDAVRQPLRSIDPKNKLEMPPTSRWKRFSPVQRGLPRPKSVDTGRTAVILRAWSTFEWAEENMWVLRSLVTEAALATGGEYTVYILMDVKDDEFQSHPTLYSDPDVYEDLLDKLVPAEFRDMTVLFNLNLLEAWYPLVKEYRPEYQMFQPLQLFAQRFPYYDNYFQLEMDVRFTGHAGDLLRSIAAFARNEPRKQARQRASFAYLPKVYNTYRNFTQQVDAALDHTDAYYEGIRIPDFPKPFGPLPRFSDPKDDPFAWGVGEEADFITFSPCNNGTVHREWIYHDWISGFELGLDTPRVICPITVSRTSWNLLNAVHNAQVETGVRLQSEATMMSFALWNGAKVSLPPLPMYSQRDHSYAADELSLYVNGGPPDRAHDAMAWGEWVYGPNGDEYRQNTSIHGGIAPTWRFKTPYPQDLWDAWMAGDNANPDDIDPEALPTLIRRDGHVYLPNTMFHPVKTNKAPSNRPTLGRLLGVGGT